MAIEQLRRPDQEPRERTLYVTGGIPLEGSLELPGAKNLALQALAVPILTNGVPVTLSNFPDILDTRANLGILEGMGARVYREGDSVTIETTGLNPQEIRPEDSVLTTGSRYLIPPLVTRFGEIKAGPPGGDQIGASDRFRFNAQMLAQYEQLGIGHREVSNPDGTFGYVFYELSPQESPRELRLEERYFGPTIQALLRFSGSDRDFTIIKPNMEPEVEDTIQLLQSMGADIEYEAAGFETGDDQLHIRGRGKLSETTFKVSSDPNAMVSYAAMALITDGDVTITGIDHNQKVAAFVKILERMNADFTYDTSELRLKPSIGKLTGVNLSTDFWPAECHTDWQQILTPVLSVSHGQSIITENVYPDRLTNAGLLNFMGADLRLVNDPSLLSNAKFQSDGRAHSLRINGNPNLMFTPTFAQAPKDVRGATGLLIAMLSASGQSRLSGADQLFRGLEDVDRNLRLLGARISTF